MSRAASRSVVLVKFLKNFISCHGSGTPLHYSHVQCFLFFFLFCCFFYFCSVPRKQLIPKTEMHLKAREWHLPWHCCQRNSIVCWSPFVLRRRKDVISLGQEPFFIGTLANELVSIWIRTLNLHQTISARHSLRSSSFRLIFWSAHVCSPPPST